MPPKKLNEVSVRAGDTFVATVEVDKSNALLAWQFHCPVNFDFSVVKVDKRRE